jgi:hypothetical protein
MNVQRVERTRSYGEAVHTTCLGIILEGCPCDDVLQCKSFVENE